MDLSDGGLTSRKLHLTWLTMALATVGYGVTGIWPTLVPVYPEYVTALLAATAVYAGGNIMAKKILKDSSPPSDEPPPPSE